MIMTEKQIKKVLSLCGINYRTKVTAHNTSIMIKVIDIWTGKKKYIQFFYDIGAFKSNYDIIFSIANYFAQHSFIAFENESTYKYISDHYNLIIK